MQSTQVLESLLSQPSSAFYTFGRSLQYLAESRGDQEASMIEERLNIVDQISAHGEAALPTFKDCQGFLKTYRSNFAKGPLFDINETFEDQDDELDLNSLDADLWDKACLRLCADLAKSDDSIDDETYRYFANTNGRESVDSQL